MITHFAKKIEKIRTHAPPSPIPPPAVPTTLLRAAGLFTIKKEERIGHLFAIRMLLLLLSLKKNVKRKESEEKWSAASSAVCGNIRGGFRATICRRVITVATRGSIVIPRAEREREKKRTKRARKKIKNRIFSGNNALTSCYR